MNAAPAAQGWPEFRARHADLLAWPDNPLFDEYPRDVLSDPVARERFVAPLVRNVHPVKPAIASQAEAAH